LVTLHVWRVPRRALPGALWRVAAGRTPSGDPHRNAGGRVLVLTRARLRTTRAATFWRRIPYVAEALDGAPGLLAAFGLGEAPVGRQGTVSLWRDSADASRFAYRQPEHGAAVAATPVLRWYAEELFARFAVLDVAGEPGVLGWREGRDGRR